MREFRFSHVNPYCVLKDLLVNLWVILLCAAIGWMGAQVVLENLYKPEYTSFATFYVTPKDSTRPAYSNISTGSRMAGVLGTLFTSPILEQKAAEALDRGRLPARIEASPVEYTNLLRLKAIAATPEDAFRSVRALMENHDKVSDYVINNAVVEVLEPPQLPSSPSNFIPLGSARRNAAAVGALLAAAAIVALSVLRDTVKTQDAVRDLVDAPLYGTLRQEVKNKTLRSKLKRVNKSVLITNPVTSFHYAEAIRQMCTRLEYAASLRGLKTVLVASAGENEGKSTVTVNLALGLARRGYRVLLMDGDLKRPAVRKLLDVPAGEITNLSDCLQGRARLEDALYRDSASGLTLLMNKGSARDSADLLSSDSMKALMARVQELADFVLVDSPPVALTADTETLASLCGAALLVVRQDHSYVHTINDAVDKLSENTQLLGAVFNRARTLPLPGGSYGRRYDYEYKKA